MINTTQGKILWILDNGHGNNTPGKSAPILTDGRQFHEYRFNREVVGNIMARLEEKRLRPHQLVPEETDISPTTRTNDSSIYIFPKIKNLTYLKALFFEFSFQE